MAPILVYQDALVTVRATLVNHGPVYGSFAFRFDTADGAVVFSGDTGYPCSNLVQLAQGADVLVHEVIDPAFINNLFPPPLTPATTPLPAGISPVSRINAAIFSLMRALYHTPDPRAILTRFM